MYCSIGSLSLLRATAITLQRDIATSDRQNGCSQIPAPIGQPSPHSITTFRISAEEAHNAVAAHTQTDIQASQPCASYSTGGRLVLHDPRHDHLPLQKGHLPAGKNK